MIEIKISDPYNTPSAQLRAVAALLVQIAGDDALGSHLSKSATVSSHTHAPTIRTTDPAPTIAPDDNPAAGVDAAEVFAGGANPAEVFAGGADPAQVFGAGAHPELAPGPASSVTPPPPPPLGNEQAAGSLPTVSGSAAVASAPVQNTDLAPVPNGSIDLDKHGLPWDARIHSESKNKNKDGSWRNKRGVAPEVVTAVEAELRVVLGNSVPAAPIADTATGPVGSTATETSAPAVVPPPPPPAVASQVAPAPASQVAEQPAASVAPNPGAVPPPPPPSDTAATATAITFPQLCARITNALNGGQLTQERLGQVLGAHKLTGLPTLAAFPHLVPTVATELGFA